MTIQGKSNLSFILDKPLSLSFADRPVPELSTPHDVLIAIDYTGICGSDVHYWQHGSIGPYVVKDPMVLGHESAGTIVKVGDAVKTLKIGDRVAVEPGYPCRRCTNCLVGKYNLCPDMRFAATPPFDGTLTGFWAAPEDFCYKLPENVSTQEGALIEPLAVGVHIVRQARISPGASVVVMGAGPVGLLIAAVAKAYGASKIGIVDIVPAKLEFAKQFAATHTYLSQRVSPEENAANIRRDFDLPNGADVVIDASGAEPSIQASIHVVRIGGIYVQGGMGRDNITFPIMALCTKEVEAHGSFRYGSGDYKLAVELVATGKIPVKMLISSVVAFDQAEEAFKKVKEGQVIKILIAGPNEKVEGGKAEEIKTVAEQIPSTETTTTTTTATPAVETAVLSDKTEHQALPLTEKPGSVPHASALETSEKSAPVTEQTPASEETKTIPQDTTPASTSHTTETAPQVSEKPGSVPHVSHESHHEQPIQAAPQVSEKPGSVPPQELPVHTKHEHEHAPATQKSLDPDLLEQAAAAAPYEKSASDLSSSAAAAEKETTKTEVTTT